MAHWMILHVHLEGPVNLVHNVVMLPYTLILKLNLSRYGWVRRVDSHDSSFTHVGDEFGITSFLSARRCRSRAAAVQALTLSEAHAPCFKIAIRGLGGARKLVIHRGGMQERWRTVGEAIHRGDYAGEEKKGTHCLDIDETQLHHFLRLSSHQMCKWYRRKLEA